MAHHYVIPLGPDTPKAVPRAVDRGFIEACRRPAWAGTDQGQVAKCLILGIAYHLGFPENVLERGGKANRPATGLTAELFYKTMPQFEEYYKRYHLQDGCGTVLTESAIANRLVHFHRKPGKRGVPAAVGKHKEHPDIATPDLWLRCNREIAEILRMGRRITPADVATWQRERVFHR